MPNDRVRPHRSDLPEMSADSIAGRRFGQTWRGFDPEEVKSFLDQVAAQIRALNERVSSSEVARREAEQRAAHPVMDEATLMAAVGEETATILRSARSAAAEISAKAESAASSRLAAAEAEAADILAKAQAVLSERTVEAQRAAQDILERAQQEAARIQLEAEQSQAEVSADAARRAEETVEGAQALREKILTDLARRRKLATVQIEQLRAGRERLLDAYMVVRRTLDEVTDELQRADAEARAASDAVGRQRVGEGPELLDLRGDDVWAPLSNSAGAPPGSAGEPGPAVPEGSPPAGTQEATTGKREAPAGKQGPSSPGPSSPGPSSPGQTALPTQPVPGQPAPGPLRSGQAATQFEGRPAVVLAPKAADLASGRANGGASALSTDRSANTPGGGQPSRQAPVSASTRSTLTAAHEGTEVVESVRLLSPAEVEQVQARTADRAQAPAAPATQIRPASPSQPAEAPVAEAPVAEAPVAEAPAAGAPKAGNPVTGPPAALAQAAEAPERDVQSLFARLRASREEATAQARRSLAAAQPATDEGTNPVGAEPTKGAASVDGAGALGEPVSNGQGPVAGVSPSADLPQVAFEAGAGSDPRAPHVRTTDEPEPDDPGAQGPAQVSAVPATSRQGDAPGDDFFVRRAQQTERLESSLGRKLKRALQDEQNSLLDRLRNAKGTPHAAALLPGPEEHADRFVEAGRPLLRDAAEAGRTVVVKMFPGLPVPDLAVGLVDDLAEELGRSITEPLRQRLEESFERGEGDPTAIAEALGIA